MKKEMREQQIGSISKPGGREAGSTAEQGTTCIIYHKNNLLGANLIGTVVIATDK